MASSHNRRARFRSALTAIPVVTTIGVIVVGGAVVALLMRPGGDRPREAAMDLHTVRRGSFQITTPCSGELTAANQVEIRNQLESRAVITEIKDEGANVKKGDVLLRFNDEEIVNSIKDAQDAVSTAENDFIAAETGLEIKQKEQDSELEKARLAVTLADLDHQAWLEGDSVQLLNEYQLGVETSQKEYDRLVERYKRSQELFEKKFISEDDLKQDEIALIRAEAELDKAKTQLDVYQKYTYLQDKAQKESDLEQARAELERVEQRFDAEVRQARSQVDSRRYKLNSAKERLEKLQRQLQECTVAAPSAGLVVYASSLESSRWGNSEDPPQVGTEVHRNRLVMILPDTSEMVAEVKVNEALSGLIEPGQRATVISDAVPDRTFEGVVESVGVMAVSGGWVDRNRRDYTVRIKLDTPPDHGLKPAMRCKAEIFVDQVTDALHVPSQAVFWAKGRSFVYVPREGGYAQQAVTVGRSSELYTEILDGLVEGEAVLLKEPRPERVVSRLELRDDRGQGGPGPDGQTQARRGGRPRQGGPGAAGGGQRGGGGGGGGNGASAGGDDGKAP